MHRPGRILGPVARVAAAGTLALTATIASVVAAHAYPAPAGTASLASSASSVAEGSTSTLTFTLLNSSNVPVSGATVTWSVNGVSGSSVTPGAATNGSGVTTATFNAGSNSADCGKTATILGTSGSTQAQTTIAITCSSNSTGLGGLLGSIFTTVLNTLNVGNILGTLTGTSGGTTYTLTVPAGALPSGTPVSILGVNNLAAIDQLLSSGQTLVDAFDVTWPGGVAPTSPITLTIHNAAIQAGDILYEITSNGLTPFPGATVGNGVVTIPFNTDPAFAVVAPTTTSPNGLGDEGAGAAAVASTGHPKRIAAGIVAGVLVLAAIVAVVVVRRRRALAS